MALRFLLPACAVAIICAALLLTGYGSSRTELLDRSAVKNEGRQEMLAAAAQERLAKKDARIFKSLELAAQKKVESGVILDKEFIEARNKQIVLDERLAQLNRKLQAQRQALAYIWPRTMERATITREMKLGEKKLAATLPKLHKDILAVRQALKKTLDEVKPAKKELRTSDEILMKSENAYKLFGARIEQSREKARLARQQEQELRMGAMLAERASQQLKTKANASSNKNEAAMLLQESKEQSSKADMYRKQADESVQTAQLLEAEADEAASYMSMFGSDLTQASMRRKQALGKLEFLSQQYQRGSLLEQAAVQKERALAYQMNNAEHSLTQDRKELKQDEAALATGEKATAKTVTELNVDKKSAVQNYKGAIADLTKIRQDKAKYVRDAEQAMEVENQAFAHNQASEHLKLASEAAAAEIKK